MVSMHTVNFLRGSIYKEKKENKYLVNARAFLAKDSPPKQQQQQQIQS